MVVDEAEVEEAQSDDGSLSEHGHQADKDDPTSSRGDGVRQANAIQQYVVSVTHRDTCCNEGSKGEDLQPVVLYKL